MVLTEKQLEIFSVFVKQPFAELTRKQIKNEANEKSNNALSLAISQFRKENIIIEKKVGKSGLLKLNLRNDLSFFYIALANEKRVPKTAKETIERIKEEIEGITPFYSLAIFGSYAIGNQKQSSDLDIAIFIEDKKDIKKIEAAINSAKLKSLVEIDSHVITKSEFTEMLVNNEENVGKQIARKHLAVYNHSIFYDLVREGVKHGFTVSTVS